MKYVIIFIIRKINTVKDLVELYVLYYLNKELGEVI